MDTILTILFGLLLRSPLGWILALAAAPALALLAYVRKKDKLEPEPKKLVWSLFGLGALSTLMAMLGEALGIGVLRTLLSPDSLPFKLIHWFFVVGIAEEGSKFFFLRRRTKKEPAFNCTYDGVVYGTAVAAGFAALENILYYFRHGVGVLLPRALISVPGHICFGILMGVWYGLSREAEIRGDEKRAKDCRFVSVALPALLHGLFDILASMGGGLTNAAFLAFVIALVLVSWNQVKKSAENDRYFTPQEPGEGTAAENKTEEMPVRRKDTAAHD